MKDEEYNHRLLSQIKSCTVIRIYDLIIPMNIRQIRFSLKKILRPLLLVSLMVYFSYHIFQGRHGLLAWGNLSKELTDRQGYLNDLKNTQVYLQHKVNLLGSNLCLDLLEEEAKKLGMAHQNEVVIVLDK